VTKEKLFSITKKDFRWDYFSGTGAGGQHRNRHKNSVRCFHDPSGAVGSSQDEKSKEQNMKKAWRRCIETKEFKQWLKIETSRATGELARIEKEVDKQMSRTRVDVRDEKGNWIEEHQEG
jgi:peptide chain release factor 1